LTHLRNALKVEQLETSETKLLGQSVKDALRLSLLLQVKDNHIVLVRVSICGLVQTVAALCEEVTMHYQFHLLFRSLEVPRIANQVGYLSSPLLHGPRLVIRNRAVLNRWASLDYRGEYSEAWHFNRLPLLAQY
jgi:hypothetical protein